MELLLVSRGNGRECVGGTAIGAFTERFTFASAAVRDLAGMIEKIRVAEDR